MAIKGFKRKIKPLEIMTEEDVISIQTAVLDILKNTGVRFESKWSLDFLKKNDCIVDYDDMRVRFPESLVEENISKAPSSFRAKAREEKYDQILGGTTVYFQNGPGMKTIDLKTFEPRVPTKSEYEDYIKVLDSLPNVHGLSCYPYFGYKDIPEVMGIPESVAIKIMNSTKFLQSCYASDCEIFNIKMAKEAGIEILSGLHASSPLTVGEPAIMNARRMIDAGFPIFVADGTVYGGTGPATAAGGLTINCAEILSQIMLVQLIKPGTRVLVWDVSWPMNMVTGSPNFGQIADSIENVMFNQVWRTYKLPIANGTPGYSNAKNIGFQNGYERGIACLLSALSGANLIQFHGSICGEITAHPLQAILDDDIAGMVGRFIEGETINDETIALDLIEEVGPIPGSYLNTSHTRKWWQIEQYMTKAADKLTYDSWIDGGKKNDMDYAKEIMDDILYKHKTIPLEEEKVENIMKILEEARKYYKEKDML
jgi:trimethylamine---corrinoid protein Co-methyltransferase